MTSDPTARAGSCLVPASKGCPRRSPARVSRTARTPGGRQTFTINPSAGIGTSAITLTATDNLGNASGSIASATGTADPLQARCWYEVIYMVSGFGTPIENDSLNSASPGQGVAVKWRIGAYNPSAAATVKVVNVPGVTDVNPTFLEVTSSTQSSVCNTVPNWRVESEDVKGGSNLQNQGGGNFQFNWATLKTFSNTCRTMALRLVQSGLVGPAPPITNVRPQPPATPTRIYGFANFKFKAK